MSTHVSCSTYPPLDVPAKKKKIGWKKTANFMKRTANATHRPGVSSFFARQCGLSSPRHKHRARDPAAGGTLRRNGSASQQRHKQVGGARALVDAGTPARIKIS